MNPTLQFLIFIIGFLIILGLFTLALFELGFLLLVLSTLAFTLWSHVWPRAEPKAVATPAAEAE